jgi:hypothetical protein
MRAAANADVVAAGQRRGCAPPPMPTLLPPGSDADARRRLH